MDCIYYCSNDENNNCPKKTECKRYNKVGDNCSSTLYKESCTEQNGHVLFIKDDVKEENKKESEV